MQAACAVKDNDVIGVWVSTGGQNDFFESFELSPNHHFNSWLHDRPEIMNATWQLKDCILRIYSSTAMTKDTLEFIYRVKLKKAKLVLIEDIDDVEYAGIYRRAAK
ncbi:MAG: hypothetical protein SFU55_07685 [Methylophilus sp.]|nr:hypothetical protein [Methylophilus sp.]